MSTEIKSQLHSNNFDAPTPLHLGAIVINRLGGTGRSPPSVTIWRMRTLMTNYSNLPSHETRKPKETRKKTTIPIQQPKQIQMKSFAS